MSRDQSVLRLSIIVGLVLALGCQGPRGQDHPVAEPPIPLDESMMQAALTKLERALRENDGDVFHTFRPGLGSEQIDQRLSAARYPCSLPGEVRQWFQWRNGSQARDFLFYHQFLSLEEALEAWRRDGGLYRMPTCWLPLFEFQEEYFYVVADQTPPGGVPVWHRLLESPEPTWSFTHLGTLAETVAEWYQQRAVWRQSQTGFLAGDEGQQLAIHSRLNPGATYPYAVN